MHVCRFVEGVRLTVVELVGNMALFRDILCFFLLGLACVSLVGTTLFHGSLAYDCASNAPQSFNITKTWPCPETLACQVEANSEQQCFELSEPRADPEGLFSFDNFFKGVLTAVYVMSQDAGPQVIPQALEESGATAASLAWPFTILCIVFLSLVGLQLMLALVAGSLTNVQQGINHRAHTDRVFEKYKRRRQRESRSLIPNLVGGVDIPFDQGRQALLELVEEQDSSDCRNSAKKLVPRLLSLCL
jgi:hypothetical protein